MSYLIRTDGNARLGMGHVKRCLSLADALDAPAVFALRHTSPAMESMIRQYGHGYGTMTGDFSEEPALLRKRGGDRGIFLDFSHPETLLYEDKMTAYVAALKSLFPAVALIDGMGPDSLCGHADIRADVTIVPYVDARAGEHGAWLTGPRYFILPPEYRSIEKPKIRREANRILITAGGGDPASITLLALAALERLPDREMAVRIAVGPDFSSSLKKKIGDKLRTMSTPCRLLHAPSSLLADMIWCDLCISASGLTKYELAATGTPAVLISPDPRLALANKGFTATGVALDLGVAQAVTPEGLATAVGALLDDPKRREKMAQSGRKLLDGQGAQRIVGALKSIRR